MVTIAASSAVAEAPARPKRNPRKQAAAKKATVPAQAAAPVTVAEDEPRYVGDLRVIKDEPLLSPLGKVNGKQVTFSSYRIWTLEDNTRVHVCARCYEFTGSRGDVRKHLVAAHGMKSGGAGSHRSDPSNTTTAVTNFMSLSMAEVVELVQSSGQWGEMLDAAETAAAEWKERALTAEAENKRFRNTFDRLGFVPKETD